MSASRLAVRPAQRAGREGAQPLKGPSSARAAVGWAAFAPPEAVLSVRVSLRSHIFNDSKKIYRGLCSKLS